MIPEHDTLPCGAELEPLMAQVADGRPPPDALHQSSCPYCQAALRSLRLGWQDVTALAREPVPVPRGLTARVMTRVRGLARYAAGSVVLGHPRGATRVSHTVIGQIVQRVAASVPGVVLASARPIAHDPPDPARLSVAVRLVVAFGPPVDALADAVRQCIERRVPALTGAVLSRVDIAVVDVADDASGQPARCQGLARHPTGR